tara:strand:+ start:9743 stop:10675 length:933 start_codon:yes stop_codon:yes gene_type:complete
MVNCKECEEKFKNYVDLHRHLRSHKMLLVDYYHKHYPKKDLLTGEFIKFKNRDQYLSDDFNTKTNMKKWLKELHIEKAREYCESILLKRKEDKGIEYAPSQVELRSLLSPPTQYFNEIFSDYYDLCDTLGLKNKYVNPTKVIDGKEYDKKEYKILIDTREQKPLKFDRETVLQKLDYGDYAFSHSEHTCNCHIERKSLADFISTMSGGHDRFIKEIERAREENSNLIILVEENLNNALGFKYLPHISKKIKASPEFIFHRVRNLIQQYSNIQFLFVNGRKESSRIVELIFTCGCCYKKIDLQLAYDNKVL